MVSVEPTLCLYKWDVAGDKEAELAINRWMHVQSDIVSFSFGKGIIALFEDGAWSWTEVTKLLDNKLRGRQRTLPRPTYVCTDTGKNYFINFADGKCEWNGPHSFTEAIYNNRSPVSKVAFAPHNGWYILFEDGSSLWNGLPKDLHLMLKRQLLKQQKSSLKVKGLSISPEGHWFVSFSDSSWYVKLPPGCRRTVDSLLHECAPRIDHIYLGKEGAFCICYEVQGKETHLSPWEISFSETSVPAHFADGCSLWKTISDLEKNILDPTKFPPIRVVRKDKRWISLDNRRLFVFQNAAISSIPVITFDASPQKTFNIHRSVNIPRCNCKQCGYDNGSREEKNKQEKSNNDAWARSWSWLLFLKEKNPPSALLLADSLILPSVQQTRRYLPKYISSICSTTAKVLRHETGTPLQLISDNIANNQLPIIHVPVSASGVILK